MDSAPSRARLLTAALACMLLAACQVRFTDQEVVLRHDPAADELELLLVYRGVTAPKDEPQAVDRAVETVREMLLGRRRLAILDWPGAFDLDDPDEDVAPGGDLSWFREHLHLLEVSAFIDEDGRLAGMQRFRLVGVVETLRRVNAAMARALLEADEKGKLDKALSLLDPETRLVWRDEAAAGRPWLSMCGGRIVVDLPAPSPEGLATILQGLLALEEQERTALASFLGTVSFRDGRMQLQLGHAAGDATRFRFHNPEVTYRPALAERLKAEALLDG